VAHLRLLERRIEVAEGISEVNGTLYVGPLKTKESRRVVTIPTFLADELRRHLVGARRTWGRRPGLPLAVRWSAASNELRSSLLDSGHSSGGHLPRPDVPPPAAHSSPARHRRGRTPEGDPGPPRSRVDHDDVEHLRASVPLTRHRARGAARRSSR
jgi:hypothetical protein